MNLRSPALIHLDRGALLMVVVSSIVINLLLLTMPIYSLQIYDRVLTSRSVDTLVFLSLMVLLVLTASVGLEIVRGRLLLRIGNKYVLSLGPQLLDSSILQSAYYAVPSGQSLRDLQIVRGFISSQSGICILFDALLVPLFVSAVYLMHVGLGHAMLFGIFSLLALAWVTELLTGPHLRKVSDLTLLSQRRIDSVMQNAEAVEAMGMRAAMYDYWQVMNGPLLANSSLAGDRATAINGLTKWVRWFINLLITALGAWYVIHDEITLGGMIAANLLSARGLAPMEGAIGAWRGLVAARCAVDRISDTLNKYSRSELGIQFPTPKGGLNLDNVVYIPPGCDKPSIKGVSLKIPAGSLVGLIGPSSSGKSTLAKLICGVWRPRSGSARLDGADVSEWKRADFGQHCGYLPQDVELFAGSVRENIARFRDSDDAKIIAAATMAGAHQMILRLPKGYDTQVGPGGSALSAGQRQHIGLARALFGSPRLVVLDEPNSNLDAEGEDALVNAVAQVKHTGATILMVCHRRSLLANADLLCVLADGQVEFFGPPEEVMLKLQYKAGVRGRGEVSCGFA